MQALSVPILQLEFDIPPGIYCNEPARKLCEIACQQIFSMLNMQFIIGPVIVLIIYCKRTNIRDQLIFALFAEPEAQKLICAYMFAGL